MAQVISPLHGDDSFQLYDLRIEAIICPPGEGTRCGTKAGDFFTLQGEMLYLPPGQGISIYGLCTSLCTTLQDPGRRSLMHSSNSTSSRSRAMKDTHTTGCQRMH